jgi:hypothetical protein
MVGPARGERVAVFARDIGEGDGLVLEGLGMLVFLGIEPLLVGHHLEEDVMLEEFVDGELDGGCRKRMDDESEKANIYVMRWRKVNVSQGGCRIQKG